MGKKDLIYKRYRRSIGIDAYVWITPGILCTIGLQFIELTSLIRLLAYIVTFLIMFGYLASDSFFKNQSFGKKLLNLQLVNKAGSNQKLEFSQIIKRRFLEFIMLFFRGKRGYDLYRALEDDTNSRIIEVAKS